MTPIEDPTLFQLNMIALYAAITFIATVGIFCALAWITFRAITGRW